MRWVRVLALTVAFFLVCTIVGAIAIGLRVADGFDAIRENWNAYRVGVEPRDVYIGQVYDAFENNGFTVRYRQYVATREVALLNAMQRDYENMQAAILRYETIDLTEAEASALDNLRIVLARYADVLEEAVAVRSAGGILAPPDGIDALSRDTASTAIGVLDRELTARREDASTDLDRTVMLGINLVTRGAWILPILIFASLLLVWLLRRLVSETENRTLAEAILRDSEERYRDLYDNAPNAYYTVDAADGVILRSNAAFCEMLGWPPGSLDGLKIFDLFAETENGLQRAEALFEQFRRGEGVRGVELQMRHKSGRLIWTALTAEPICDDDGKVVEVRSIDVDITDRKRAEEEIRAVQDELVRRANYDELTGLPNRTLLLDRLAQALIRAQRQKDNVALMFIDLDRFKNINDTYGHDAGDRLLKDAAKRLRGCVREGDTVARLAGDEFVIVLSSISNENDAALVAGKVVSAFGTPFHVDSKPERVSASVGIAIYPNHGLDLHSLLRNADAAMYSAKQQGRNTFIFFSADEQGDAADQPKLEDHLRRALEDGELALHYQAIVDGKTRQVVGVEALLRWNSHVLGEVDPLRFIPVAEAQGTIVAIGEWVLRTTCEQMTGWLAEGPERKFTLSVNVSSKQISGGHILNSVKRAVVASGLQASRLELEITENLVIEHGVESLNILNQLADLGVRLCVDDFGTGYSSLMYIKRYPFNGLKLDQSFIVDVARDGRERTLAKAIIDMAHGLGLVVTAEGVETEEQVEALLAIGCDRFQGNYFFSPSTPEDFIAYHDRSLAAAEEPA